MESSSPCSDNYMFVISECTLWCPQGSLVESVSHNPIYKVGCLRALGDFINDHAMAIGGVMLGILIPQVRGA